jgi:addiction module HigA family antidote
MNKGPDRRWRARNAPKAVPPTHPGEMLQEEFLRPLHIDPRALAPRIGILTADLLDLLEGRARVTPELAQRLSAEFGTAPDVWLNLQQQWDAWERRDVES